jgi:hypothetical protein
MKDAFYIEGHKSKADYEDEETLILNDKNAYASEEEATRKAQKNMQSNPEIDLVVVYKRNREDEQDEREGIKFLFRTKENEIQEVKSWWNKPLEKCKSCK